MIKKNVGNNTEGGWGGYILAKSLTLLVSLVVTCTNLILSLIIRWMSKKEKHETHTELKKSVGFKLSLAQAVNTVVLPYLMNIEVKNWFNQGGLSEDIFFITVTTAFVTPTVYLFNPGYFFKRCKRTVHMMKGRFSGLT